MTAPTTYAQFGQTLAFAERTMSEVLRRHLAERQVVPETWYALKLIATRGPGLARTSLTADLAGSRGMNSDSTRELLERLESEGLIEGGASTDLTSAGQELYARLSKYVLGATTELLGQFEPGDIDTTIRTLQAVTERASAGLA
jgi:DNA-binding MarR family transcriptional regulator